MRRADNLITFMCRLSLNSESLNLLEPLGPVQACKGIALPLHHFICVVQLWLICFYEVLLWFLSMKMVPCGPKTCRNIQCDSFIHSFISIQPQRLGWQEPEPSHVTGMALAHCILGKSLGVVCHCFSPPLDVPTFAARCLYVRNDARDPSSERWNCGRETVR